MRRITLVLSLLTMVACKSRIQEANKNIDPNAANIVFKETQFDFGDMKEGQVEIHEYYFTNEGPTPLIISDVQVQCGCTVPNWPKEPINPGIENKITVKFNSAGKHGKQNKTVTIVSNSVNKTDKITFTANVLPSSGENL